MSSAGLPTLESATSAVLSELAQHRVVAVEGPPASGKSTVLRDVASRLLADQRSTVFLSLRRSFGAFEGRGSRELFADDAASVLLASAGAQLDPAGEGLLDLIKQPSQSWQAKVDAVRTAATESETVFVIDELPVFEHPERTMCSIFEQRTFGLLEALRSTDQTRLVFGSNGASYVSSRVQIPPRSPVDAVLSPARWNGLGAAAQQLLSFHVNHPARSRLQTLSPLQLRLAVALVYLGESIDALVAAPLSLGALVDSLFDKLGKNSRVWKVLGRLALVRVPFRRELLEFLGGSTLSSNERKLLETCLLYGAPEELHLHELLRAAAVRRGWAGLRNRETHRVLGTYHRSQFELAQSAANLVDATVHELELVHHLTQAGDESALDEARIYFADQYDVLGKALSLRKRYASAVRAYDRALAHAPDDWYAHHYRAFNLDVQGVDAAEVERGYERAVELEPDHLWNHSRLTCFYITRSRTEMAERSWTRFRNRFSLEPIANDERLYDSVHKHVARLLLDRGELEFAHTVLGDVPGRFQRLLPWLQALKYLHARLAEAEADNVVFPASIEPDRRWRQPHTVAGDTVNMVVRWQPGRISGISEDLVHIRVARHDSDAVEYGWADLDRATLEAEWGVRPRLLSAGRFVELLWLDDGGKLLGTHSPKEEPIPGLPGLWPPPDRYIRRRVLSGHEPT